MTHALIAVGGELAGQSFPIERELVVGRSEGSDLRIQDPRLSRRHARFYVEDGALFVEDLGSPNGTLVNSVRVSQARLAPGDTVALSKSVFKVAGAPAERGLEAELVKPFPSLRDVLQRHLAPALDPADPTVLELEGSLESLRRKTRDLALLHEVAHAIQHERDHRAMLGRVLELVLRVTQADRAYAGLVDEQGALHIEVVRHSARVRPSGASARVSVSQTVSTHVLEHRSAVLCADRRADARFQDAASLMLHEVRALMATPLLVAERALGLMGVESSHLGPRFTEADLDLLTVIASMAGVALDNLRLAERREETIRALEAAQAELLHTQEQLVRSEQLAVIGRLAAGLAHEVKNHLSPFMLADMIRKKYPGDRQIQDAAEMMLEAQQHILDLVNEVRNFASGAEAKSEREPHDLAEVVERVLRFLQCDNSVKRARVTLEVEQRPLVQVDLRGFRQVLINLIRNAADALPEAGGTVSVRVSEDEDAAVVEVADDGRGIPAEVAPHIFEPFFSTKGERGLGLGLDISKKIVEAHRGHLSFVSEPGVGTTFWIRLPR